LALSAKQTFRFGNAKIVIISTVCFGLASLGCALAWSFESLLVFRVIQGVFAGALMTIPLSIVYLRSPDKYRHLNASIILLLIVLGHVCGPIIGGFLTENLGWRSIFFINIPVCTLAVMCIWTTLMDWKEETQKLPLDLTGFILLSIALLAFQIVLDRGQEMDWLNSLQVKCLIIVSLLSGALFIAWNYYTTAPLINFSFYKNRNFILPIILVCIPFLAIGGSLIILPLWLQTQQGYTPSWAGLTLVPLGIFPIVLTPIVNYLRTIIGFRILITIGYIFFIYTTFWFSTLTAEISFGQLLLPRLFQGVGIALSLALLPLLAFSQYPEEMIAEASGVFNFSRLVFGGAGISTALYVTFWQRFSAQYRERLIELLQPYREASVEAFFKLQNAGVEEDAAAEIFSFLVDNQASILAFNDLMYISAWGLILVMPLIWMCDEPVKIYEDEINVG
jgi:DHA2 family multidrug resistance protein